jgi:adenylosuccinate synthase
MKLDVVDVLDSIKVGIDYILNGKTLTAFPASLEDLARVEVEYHVFPGWRTSIKACRRFEDLPWEAQAFVEAVEDLVQIPIRWVGVGSSRDAMIRRW